MEEGYLKLDSDFTPSECAVDGGVDRISPLPDEILYLILSYLPVRKAASTTVLSSRWLDLWKGIPNLKFNLESDRISRLPDKIILEILSFLTLKNVLATSVLSSRWSDLWKHNPCIDFYPHLWRLGLDDRLRRSLSRAECIEVVNSIVQSHKSLSLKLFRLRFCVKESDKCSVTRWLEFLFSREVERLVLNFECSDDPDMVVLEESLRESGMYGAPQDLPFFKSIRRVWLGYLKVSGEDIKLFICNSPLLEYLSITSATFTSDVEVCGASDLVLDRLIFSGCKGGKSIKVSAPNLTLMEFCKNSSKLLVENVPRLAQASFESYDLDVVQQVANISQLQTLDVTIKYPMMAPWTNGFHQMPNLRKLFVRFSGRHGYSLLQIITLIWALPHLECFSLMNGIGDPLAPSVLSNCERPKHQNLKVFEFNPSRYRFQSLSDQIVELLTYVLDNCVALQKVIFCGTRCEDPIRRAPITAHTRAAVNDLRQMLQGKVEVASHIQLQFFGCSTLIEAAASASMDGEGLDLPPKLKKVNRECCASRVVDGGVDRISQLPDEILILILSFLPLRRAVATSVLSPRWSDLWKHVPCLDLDPHDWGMDDRRRLNASESTEIVNSVIQSHKALSLKRFRVVSYIDRAATSVVTKWLEFVFSRRVESLGLDFLPGDGDMVVLEESLREASRIRGAPHTLPFCQSLKRLSLRSLVMGGHCIELFLLNCPLLEELAMTNAFLSSDINICGAKLSLKHFYIRSRGAVSIRVSAPNLSSLRFGSTEGKLVLEYVPQLLEANLKFLTSEFSVQHTALINRLPVTVISLDKMLSTDVFSHLPNLKKLWICCIFRAVNHSLLRVADLIWASPRLEEFKFKVTATPGYDFGALMEDITNVDRSPHQHLKVFKFKMCSQPTDQLVELATCISDNCIALRKMSIGSRVREQSHWDSIKQQVQGKVRSQIQLRFYSL